MRSTTDLRAAEVAGLSIRGTSREDASRIVNEWAELVSDEIAQEAVKRCLLIDEAEMTRRVLVRLCAEGESAAPDGASHVMESVRAAFDAAAGRDGLPLGDDDQVGPARAAFHRLGTADREAIMRVHILGCTVGEVASELGQDPSVFRERLSGARKRFVEECQRFSCTDPDGQGG